MKFKYKTKFLCDASFKRVSPTKEALAAVDLDSLQDLRSLAWTDEEIAKNPDIMVWVANFAVPNVANLNGHLIDTATAIRIAGSMKNKPVNCEHNRMAIVGCVTNVGFSSYHDNKLISEKELEGTNTPFNIAGAGIVWKVADRYIASMLEECNERDSYLYEKISTSWEIGYNSYTILRGSRNISTGELIEDEKEVERLSKYLMDNGGSGLDENGAELYTVIGGDDAIFLGLAITSNPAAAVKGVGIVYPDEKKEEKANNDQQKEDDSSRVVDNFTNSASVIYELNEKISQLSQNFNKIISQNKKTVVKYKNTMNKDFASLLDSLEISEASAVTRSQLRDFVEDTVSEAGKKFKELEESKAAQEKELKETLEKAKASEDRIQSLVDEISNLKSDAEKAKKLQVFNDRMSALAETYNLDNDKIRKKVTKEISNLSDDEYTAWLEDDASVYLSKKVTEPEKKEDADPSRLLDESKASNKQIPNAGHETETKTPAPWKLGDQIEIL